MINYETVGESVDATAYPMPGQLIDVGGRRLHLSCTGSGSPTVILEPGLGEASSAMAWIAPAVARDSRVCVYDRAGRGWSDAADRPLDSAQTAADLHTLLDRAHIPGPYVLAGHSFGGLYILTFGLVGQFSYGSLPPRARDEARARSAGASYVGSYINEFREGATAVQQAASLVDLAGQAAHRRHGRPRT